MLTGMFVFSAGQEVYGQDELEEGEVDHDRYRIFGECFRRNHLKNREVA